MQIVAIFLVVMLVVPLMVLLAALAGVAMAATVERAQLRRIGVEPGAQRFPLTLDQAFDPCHALLWSTQVPALRYIGAAGAAGVRYNDLHRQAYAPAARSYPELYQGSSFAEWLFCLERAELVSLGPRRVALTPLGDAFLQYCRTELPVAA